MLINIQTTHSSHQLCIYPRLISILGQLMWRRHLQQRLQNSSIFSIAEKAEYASDLIEANTDCINTCIEQRVPSFFIHKRLALDHLIHYSPKLASLCLSFFQQNYPYFNTVQTIPPCFASKQYFKPLPPFLQTALDLCCPIWLTQNLSPPWSALRHKNEKSQYDLGISSTFL